ncbi:MAG: hypothetical protein K5657_02565 [Desulfovibrio sp.]|nr:hypothetical protein [Desulfovibrio sp.]
MNPDLRTVLDWLSARHSEVMAQEQKALECLSALPREQAAYEDALRKKAELLASMAKDALPLLLKLPEKDREDIHARLRKFSASASLGLKLGSLFYMSALLYRDEHRQGEPDLLQVYIDSLRLQYEA